MSNLKTPSAKRKDALLFFFVLSACPANSEHIPQRAATGPCAVSLPWYHTRAQTLCALTDIPRDGTILSVCDGQFDQRTRHWVFGSGPLTITSALGIPNHRRRWPQHIPSVSEKSWIEVSGTIPKTSSPSLPIPVAPAHSLFYPRAIKNYSPMDNRRAP